MSLKSSLLGVRSLLTIPGTISLAIWAIAPLALLADSAFPGIALYPPFKIFSAEYGTATSVLATIAAASMTALSLVYSLVLVVFTLAAGNIAPRLLTRFTTDRVNQTTAGLLGGSFLFALTVLHQTRADFVPVLAIGITLGLAVLSVLQLIYFVHSVAQSVTIDSEIAAISQKLEARIKAIVAENEEAEGSAVDLPSHFSFDIKSRKAGYLADIDETRLVALAERNGLVINIRITRDDFVLPGQILASVAGMSERIDAAQATDSILAAISLSPARGAVDGVIFTVDILLEIAIRALSPGINDTFTAIACLDRLSAALAEPVTRGLKENIRVGGDGFPRLLVPGLTLENLLERIFRPLRQVAAGNFLMLENLADTLTRLHEIAESSEARTLLGAHARLILDSHRATSPLAVDHESLRQRLSSFKIGEKDHAGA